MKGFHLSILFAVAGISACHGTDFTSFLSEKTLGVKVDRLPMLEQLAMEGDDEQRLTAHALLSVDYLQRDSHENDYTNVFTHAGYVLKRATNNWQTVYSSYAITVVNSAGYKPDYDAQIKHIPQLLELLERTDWDANGNPVYARDLNPRLSREHLSNLLRSLVLQAYCAIGRHDKADSTAKMITADDLRREAEISIKSHVLASLLKETNGEVSEKARSIIQEIRKLRAADRPVSGVVENGLATPSNQEVAPESH